MDTRFCVNCGDKTEYTVSDRKSSKIIRGISFSYTEEYAICGACGEPVYVPEIHDANIDRIEAAYEDCLLIKCDKDEYLMSQHDVAFVARSRALVEKLCDALEKAQAEIEKNEAVLQNC